MQRRFVVLFHECGNGDHWDLMLEDGDVLKTWSIPPQSLPLDSFQCQGTRLPDHRMIYLDYEGPISNDRGSVSRIDIGTFEEISPKRFRIRGTVFFGTVTVKRSGLNEDAVTFAFERIS